MDITRRPSRPLMTAIGKVLVANLLTRKSQTSFLNLMHEREKRAVFDYEPN